MTPPSSSSSQVNRVIFVLGEPISTPPKEITKTTLSRDSLDQLRQADHIVSQVPPPRPHVHCLVGLYRAVAPSRYSCHPLPRSGRFSSSTSSTASLPRREEPIPRDACA